MKAGEWPRWHGATAAVIESTESRMRTLRHCDGVGPRFGDHRRSLTRRSEPGLRRNISLRKRNRLSVKNPCPSVGGGFPSFIMVPSFDRCAGAAHLR